ncbi:MAG TPA: FkbM family methyltransferase [Longimicrobium sp.]|nr:FkbM family methyltransferase [Longimicrobium sp.]
MSAAFTRVRQAGRALRNAFASPGFRRFGPAFSRDYLRFAWESARRWGDQSPGEMPWMGYRVRYSNRSSILFLVHEIFAQCAYDFDPGCPDPLIVDCGANVGMAALFFRLRFPGARIVSVEPHPQAFRLLEANTAHDPAIERIEAAVSEDGAPARLYAPPGDAASLMSSLLPGLAGEAGVEVAAVRLSSLLARLDGEVDFLKLDIEGAEYGVLRDCHRTGALARVREVAVEYHRTAAEPGGPGELVRMLRESGFGEVSVTEGESGVDGMIRVRRGAR